MGVKSSPLKVSAIKDWPIPKDKKEVKSFIGLCSYYRKFVKDFATIAKPLHLLAEDKNPFIWDDSCQVSFDHLKSNLLQSPILAHPVPNLPFVLDTDASNFGIGAILSQSGCSDSEQIIAYFSKCLNKAERNYCVTRKELLAVIKAVEHFRHYLLGREFIIRTDHASLIWLLNFKNPEGQVARWLEILFQYSFKIFHRPGKNHGNADAVSRRPCNCSYCRKLNETYENKKFKFILRTVVQFDKDFDWEKLQNEDHILKILIKHKKDNSIPEWSSVSHLDSSIKIYLLHWDSLFFEKNILQRR